MTNGMKTVIFIAFISSQELIIKSNITTYQSKNLNVSVNTVTDHGQDLTSIPYISGLSNTIEGTECNITSPAFFPGESHWRQYEWKISVPKESRVKFVFLTFDLPPVENGSCIHGFFLMGTFDKQGRRRGDLGPICGNQDIGEIILAKNECWLFLFRGNNYHKNITYLGFNLIFKSVAVQRQDASGTSPKSSIQSGWFALILIIIPVLCIIPLYCCIKKRHAIKCATLDSTEVVAERFRKKHRPKFKPPPKPAGEIKIQISKPSDDEEENLSKDECSYIKGSGDYENMKSKREDFNLMRNIYLSRSSFPSTDGSLDSTVFLEESAIRRHSSENTPNLLAIPVPRSKQSQTSYLSILPEYHSTVDRSKVKNRRQSKIGNKNCLRSFSLASVKEINGEPVLVLHKSNLRNQENKNIPVITLSSASIKKKKKFPSLKKPRTKNYKASNAGAAPLGLQPPGKSAKRTHSWHANRPKLHSPEDSDCYSEPVESYKQPIRTESQTTQYHTASYQNDPQFIFPSPFCRVNDSVIRTNSQYHTPFSGNVEVPQDQNKVSQKHLLGVPFHQYSFQPISNTHLEQGHPKSAFSSNTETRLLHHQLNRDMISEVDNPAFETSDICMETDSCSGPPSSLMNAFDSKNRVVDENNNDSTKHVSNLQNRIEIELDEGESLV